MRCRGWRRRWPRRVKQQRLRHSVVRPKQASSSRCDGQRRPAAYLMPMLANTWRSNPKLCHTFLTPSPSSTGLHARRQREPFMRQCISQGHPSTSG